MAKRDAQLIAQARAAFGGKRKARDAQSVAEKRRVKNDRRRRMGANPVPFGSASKRTQAAELFKEFTGHDAHAERAGDAARELGLPIRRGGEIPLVAFGELLAVEYETIRDGVTERYRHAFRKSSRPLLAARHDGERIYIVGGRYRFTDRGIVDD